MLYLFVFTQFQTQNRRALLLELLYAASRRLVSSGVTPRSR